ncbi:XRE family transcriptional regulator [Acinetobacter piscicola]|uniref:XRE family transcriptional regulator n=1 Tax=Acinetobacter piscicola TaxID=2006115 RepID=UPI00101FE334|nr:XRE family transcriptional regulator [Acinetobacter piscicola]RYL22208.1 XRE family transcriptional regulator [Acinetobacter piscicola]
MSKVLIELSESARNARSMILQSLAVVNNGEVASKLGLDPTTLSKMKNEKKNNGLSELDVFCELLQLIGLKIVDADDVYCSLETAEATRELLRNCFNSPDYMRILFK